MKRRDLVLVTEFEKSASPLEPRRLFQFPRAGLLYPQASSFEPDKKATPHLVPPRFLYEAMKKKNGRVTRLGRRRHARRTLSFSVKTVERSDLAGSRERASCLASQVILVADRRVSESQFLLRAGAPPGPTCGATRPKATASIGRDIVLQYTRSLTAVRRSGPARAGPPPGAC